MLRGSYTIKKCGVCCMSRNLSFFFCRDGETSEHWEEEDRQETHESRIFLVEEASLRRLLTVCHECLSPCHTEIVCKGTQVYAQGKCAAGHNIFWSNQEAVRQQPILNLKLCAAILFSGCNPHVSLRMLASIGIPVITPRTFFAIQRGHLWPAIDKVCSNPEGIHKLFFQNGTFI